MNKKDKEKKQSILETVRHVDEQERKKALLKAEKEIKKQDKEREEYSKVLAEEKVELLKLKQGVISDSEKLQKDKQEDKHYTLWQKFKNFIYHNKWWLGITSFFVVIAAFLIINTLTTTKSDILFMLLSNDDEIYAHSKQIDDFMDKYTEDYNDDGKVCADMLYIPISEDEEANYEGLYESNLSRLSGEFQIGETVMVIADSSSDSLIYPEENFVNLQELYPDNPHIKGYGFYLRGTDFAKLIGYTEGDVPEDLYIALRKVKTTLSSKEDMQENYDKALETLDKIIKGIS